MLGDESAGLLARRAQSPPPRSIAATRPAHCPYSRFHLGTRLPREQEHSPLDIVSSNPDTAAHSKHSITFTCIGRNMTVANRLKRYQGIANTNVQLFPDGAAGSMGASRLPPRAAH